MPAQPIGPSAALIQQLLEVSPRGIIAVNAAGVVELWDPGAERILGLREGEATGHPLPVQFPWSEGTHGEARVLFRRPDGRLVDIHAEATAWHDTEGRRRGTLIRVTDLNARRATEQAIRDLLAQHEEASTQARADRRFRELLEAAPDAIIEIDRSGRIVLLNHSTEHLFGYSREELLGQSVDMLVPEEMRGRHAGHRTHFWDHPSTRPMGTGLTLEGQHKDGTRIPVEISLSPVRFEDSFRVTAIIRDVSERRRSEETLRIARERHTAELEVKNRELETRNLQVVAADHVKNEFLSGMSHELRTPLHTIIGYSDLLLEEMEGPLNEKQKRFLGHIHNDSMHLLALINDILDISKIEAGRLELHRDRFAVAAAVREVLGSLQPQAAAKSLDMQANVPAGTTAHADRIRFKQVLANLLSNAVKFTPPNGRVAVDARALDDRVEIAVRDTGPGIPADLQEAVFDKFYQISRKVRGSHEGTGLGLAITKRLVEQHGGAIRLESEPGQGCTFTFTIPNGS